MTTYVFHPSGGRSRRHRAHLMTPDGPEHDVLYVRRGRRFRGGSDPFRGRRAGRGDIRAAILVLLAEEPMHGYQIIQELTERTGGAWRPSPGSVYPTLQQLEDEELVRPVASETGKRVFELTDAGREHAARHEAPWQALVGESDDALATLRELAHGVMAATRQVASAGTPTQLESAQQILRDARKQLYRLLADD